MPRYFFILLFCSFLHHAEAQISIDSINNRIDTVTNPRKKISRICQYTKTFTLSSADFSLLVNKMTDIGAKSKNKGDVGYAHLQIALMYSIQKRYNESVNYAFKALSEAEKINDTSLVASANYRLGVAYKELKNVPYAKKHFYYAISNLLKKKKDEELVECFNFMGTIFKNEDQLDSALLYNKKALEIRLRLKDQKGLASTYNNMGLVYKKKKNYDLALTYLQKALGIRTELNDRKGMAGANINIGNVLIQQKQYKKALEHILKGTTIARDIKDAEFYKNGIDALGNCYYAMEDFKKAADYRLRHKNVTDSVSSEQIDKQIAELAAQYESSKKDNEIALQEEQIKAKSAQNSKQKVLIAASCIALAMALVAVFFIYRSFKQNKKSAVQLAFKNKLIEEKNKEITDSINYAKIIQQSLLAPKSVFEKNLSEYFIFYKPKDIVSGDFYWAAETDNSFTLACVDCTGHGVPGAFMSLIGKENLDKAISKTTSPNLLLSELNKGVKKSLNQNSETGSKDGMDASIAKIERKGEVVELTYSGANRPLWVIRKNTLEVEEIKATKWAVGGFTSNDQVFEEHSLNLFPGDSFFIFTDGYADQFGGNKQKKITTKLFKELLVRHRQSPLSEIKLRLEEFFHEWKGNNEQVDDILVIGIRV